MPTSAEIQKRFDNLCEDLAAKALLDQEAKVVDIAVRDADNALTVLQIKTQADGTLEPGSVNLVQAVINPMKVLQDEFNAAKFAFDSQNVPENLAAISNAYGEYRRA